MMKPYLGVWVDHKRVFLLWMDAEGNLDLQRAESTDGDRPRKKGRVVSSGSGVYGGVAPHTHLEKKRQQQATRFYDTIFKAIRAARHVYIFGPGQAKQELQRRLEDHKDFAGAIQAVESAERMSEAQMAAHVRRFFELPRMAV